MNEKMKQYIEEIVETQGKFFDYVALEYPQADTEDFVNAYMRSRTRKYIDEVHPYVCTLDYRELFDFFRKTDHYEMKPGAALQGFLPDWMGEFYAKFQYESALPSSELIRFCPISVAKRIYPGLHDLDLNLAVKKVLSQ